MNLTNPFVFVALWLASALSLHAQIVMNPGFEAGYSGWTTSAGSGTAVFTNPTDLPFVGTKLARITVTNPGSGSSPSLSTGFVANGSETYMLRYFAKSDINRPLMKIQVTSASGPVYQAATFRPSSNGWEGYHFAFRASGATTVTFTFGAAAVFNLDEVRIFDSESGPDHTGTRMDPERHHLWRWGQASVPGGLMNTDNNLSVELPDGRIAWIYNDTDTGTPNPYDNSSGTQGFVRNFLIIENNGVLTPWTPGQTSFVPTTPGNLYWPNDAFLEGNKLKVILHELNAATTFLGSRVATLSLPGMTLDGVSAFTPFKLTKACDGADGYLYLYGGNSEKKLARCLKGNSANIAGWLYWNGSSWVSDSAQAVDLANFTDFWSVSRIGPGNFVATSPGFVGVTMRASFAPAPTGPWTASVEIGRPAFEAATSFYYMPRLHPHTGQNGVYSVGYSDIGPSGADGDGPFISNRPGKDQCHYNIEYFLTPNLLDLSPFTVDSFSDDFSDTERGEWQRYGGAWTSSAGTWQLAAGPGFKAVAIGAVHDALVLETDITATGGDAGVIFRGSKYKLGPDSFRGYYAAIKPGTGVVLGRMDNGVWNLLATQPMPITNGSTHHLKVVAQGSLIQVFVDGAAAPSISLTDATYPKGSSGLRAYNSTASWDNFQVSPIPAEPYLHLRLDETSGTVASDSSGNGRNGTLVNGPTWSAGRLDNGVVLDGINDLVEFAPGVVSGLTDFTIATWVRWDGGNDWQRIFDFGTGTGNYMFLVPRGSDGKSRFEITSTAGGGPQTITAPGALPIGVWTHVAVSLSGTVGTYYINGVAVASNPNLTLRPTDLGNTNRNYIGDSQFSNDPGFNGRIDDFQIHNRALTPARIAALALPPNAPVGVTALAGEGKITLSWNSVAGTDGTFVKRSTSFGGPFSVLAWQASGTSFIDSSVVAGTTYFYVTTSSRSGAESARSAVVSAIPLTEQQAWRLAFFGISDNSGDASDSSDPDGDGNSNQVEFLAGTDPTVIGSAFVIASVVHSPSETKISFPSIAGRIYALERSETLLADSWTLVESAGIPQDAIVGTGAIIEVIDSGASAIPARFYRARVSH